MTSRLLPAALVATASMVLAASAALLAACGSTDTSSTGTTSGSNPALGAGATGATGAATESKQLDGAYSPEGDTSKGEFRALVFFGTNGYFAYANACSSDCRSQGTYTFDGVSDLELTNTQTGTTEHVDFDASTSSSGLSGQSHTLGLVNMADGGGLVSPLSALVNGVLMGLDVTNNMAGALCDPEPTAIDPKDPNQAVLDCAVQGAKPGTYDATGVCSCGGKTPDESSLRLAIESSFKGASDLQGAAKVDPSTLNQTAAALYNWNAQAGFFGQVHDPYATTYTVPGTDTTVVVVGATETTGGGPYWQFVSMDSTFIVSGDISNGSLRWN